MACSRDREAHFGHRVVCSEDRAVYFGDRVVCFVDHVAYLVALNVFWKQRNMIGDRLACFVNRTAYFVDRAISDCVVRFGDPSDIFWRSCSVGLFSSSIRQTEDPSVEKKSKAVLLLLFS